MLVKKFDVLFLNRVCGTKYNGVGGVFRMDWVGVRRNEGVGCLD